MIKHLNILVFGRVTGVYFRSTAKIRADELNIKGIAKNKSRGIYLEVEGEEANLRQFIDWCKSGPPASKVERLEVNEGPLQNYPEFKINW